MSVYNKHNDEIDCDSVIVESTWFDIVTFDRQQGNWQ